MKIKVMYYNKQFNNKPQGYENAEIQKNLKQTEIEINDLADGLSNGATFKPALLNGTKSIDWLQQQIFALDFDHDTTIEEQKEQCKKLNILPCFGYTSFSHSEKEHHFRLVFCVDKVIENREQRDKLQNTLINIFDKSDKVTFDCTRLFYGGKHLIQFDFNNQIDVDTIINTYWNDDFDNRHIEKEIYMKPKPMKQIKDKVLVNKESFKTDSNMLLKIQAIKNLDVDKMQSLLKEHTNKEIPSSVSILIQYKSYSDVYNAINSIDLSEYLGIYGYVNCILPEHEDNDPSAHIYTTTDGTQVYKCHGCGKAYTITSITEKLAQCKRSEAIEFIKKVYGFELVESDWTKKWKHILHDNVSYINSDDFKITFPQLDKLIKRRKNDIKLISQYFEDYINEDMKINDKPFFFASYDKLMEICGTKDRNKMAQSLTLFSLIDMIMKLQEKDIPKYQLNKAKHLAALKKQKKIVGFYGFEEYGTLLLEDSEEIANILKENNMRIKGLSREYILRTFGTELADKVYPQYKHENKIGTSNKSDERTSQIVECLFYCIEQKGYAMEKDVVKLLGDKYKYQTTELQLKKSLQEILMTYDLVRVKASKVNKEKYKIPEDVCYQSYVICKNNQIEERD